MRVITAPEDPPPNLDSNRQRSVFLAGGITGCSDWQAAIIQKLHMLDVDIVLFNPRRPNFPIDDPNAARGQIEWEHRWLTAVSMVSFWFPKETLCPITLFEFGRYGLDRYKQVFVGCDPEYKRRQDVEIQLDLVKPGTPVALSVEGLASQIATHVAAVSHAWI